MFGADSDEIISGTGIIPGLKSYCLSVWKFPLIHNSMSDQIGIPYSSFKKNAPANSINRGIILFLHERNFLVQGKS
jgi:hypothetical protein